MTVISFDAPRVPVSNQDHVAAAAPPSVYFARLGHPEPSFVADPSQMREQPQVGGSSTSLDEVVGMSIDTDQTVLRANQINLLLPERDCVVVDFLHPLQESWPVVEQVAVVCEIVDVHLKTPALQSREQTSHRVSSLRDDLE